MKTRNVAALGTACALCVLARPSVAQDLEGMPSFRDVLSLSSVGGVAISPDGSTVAYTVRTTQWDENGYDTEIWLARTGTEPVQLTRTPEGSSGAPQWSPEIGRAHV